MSAERAASDDGGGDAFTKFKAAWLETVALDLDLSHFAARLASVIGIHLNRGTWVAFPGQARLAEQLGATRRGVQGGIDQLVERGHLQVISSPNRKAGNTYQPLLNGVARSPTGGPKKARKAHPHANSGAHEGGFHANGHAGFMRTAVRPNHLKEPSEKEAAAQPAREGGGAGEMGSRSGSQTIDDPAQVAQADRRKALDAAWSGIVGPDRARTLGKTDALHQAIAAGDFTAEDVEAGIRDGLARGDSAPASWRWFAGWARGAKKRRTPDGDHPGRSVPRDELAAFAPPKPGTVRLNGFTHSVEEVETRLKAFAETRRWDENYFGFPPDTIICDVPREIIAKCLPMIELRNGRRVALCVVERICDDYLHIRWKWDDYFGDPPGEDGCLLPVEYEARCLAKVAASKQRDGSMVFDVENDMVA